MYFRKYIDIIHEAIGSLIPNDVQYALFDFPNHPNVGDSSIWLGEKRYLKEKIQGRVLIVDDLSMLHRKLPELPKETLIFIHGGGNLGDLWPWHQSLRERVINHYYQNRIIQFPQSIHFQDSRNFEHCRKVFNKHQDFHLVVRDYQSLELAKKLHDGPTYLAPDMALCLGDFPRTAVPSYPILGLLRTDKENIDKDHDSIDSKIFYTDWRHEPNSLTKYLNARLEKLLNKYPRKMYMLNIMKPHFYNRLALERHKRGCDILSSGEVVISNRLHGHILCTLMGIPHVVLDNIYRKIGNFRDTWSTGEGLCRTASNLQDALIKARELVEEHESSFDGE